MAIFVSYATYSVTSYQSQQNEMANQPEFSFFIEQDTSHYGSFSNGDLKIENTGGRFKSLDARYTILGDFFFSKNATRYFIPISIPLEDIIINQTGVDSQGDARIPNFWGDRNPNSTAIYELFDAFDAYVEGEGDHVQFLQFRRLLKLDYIDLYGNLHTKYYLIRESGLNSPISREDYEETLKDMNQLDLPTGLEYGVFIENWTFADESKYDTWKSVFFIRWHRGLRDQYDKDMQVRSGL